MTSQTAATSQVRTFCRVCEPSCGLVAEVEGDRITALRPDAEHPVTKGYACHKGIATLDIHHDPDRLDRPMRREPDGSWTELAWDDALGEVADRLAGVQARYGPGAVAMYTGNPLAFNALGQSAAGALAGGLGVRRSFSSGTQDCANKFTASQAVFGTSLVHPIPDIARTDLALIVGGNPRVSQGSFISQPNLAQELRAASSRGARVVFVNPRRIEVPERGLGETIQIRPDTDLYFLAALLHELERIGGWDEAVIRRHGTHVEGLRAFVAPYDADATAPITGIAPDVLRDLATAWRDAGAACAYASTGVNMGRQGTLAYWLVQALSFVTGNLDREGGNLKSDGFYPNARAGAAPFEQSYGDTEWGVLRRGALPGNLMADAILDADEPVRAMVVVAGNPVLSIGGGERLEKALASLEYLVCIDLYRNATGELAHHVLPAADMLEREDLNIVNIGLAAQPYVQFTSAVVAPRADRRPEWWICHSILRAMGRPSAFDGVGPDGEPDVWSRYRHMAMKGSGIDLDALRREPGVVVLPRPEPGRFFDDQVQTADGRVDLCPPAFAPAIERARQLFDELAAEPPSTLKLITRRDAWMMNSWFRNLDRMQRRDPDGNPLWAHPDDLAARGLADGDRAVVSNEHGALEVVVRADEDLLPGVVSMAHGWGNARTTGMRSARANPGVNVNQLLPSGPGSFEPLSSQAHMTGIRVELAALAST